MPQRRFRASPSLLCGLLVAASFGVARSSVPPDPVEDSLAGPPLASPAAPAAARHVYLVREGLETRSTLPDLARALHVVGQLALRIKVDLVAWGVFQSWVGSLSFPGDHVVKPILTALAVVHEAAKVPIWIRIQSVLHLKALQALRKQPHLAEFLERHPTFAGWLKRRPIVQTVTQRSPLVDDLLLRTPYLARLAKLPGLTRIAVLTSPRRDKAVAAAVQNDHDFVLLETTAPLPPSVLEGRSGPAWDARWGHPVVVEDPARTQVRFELQMAGRPQPGGFTISLEQLLAGERLGPALTEKWRELYRQAKPGLYQRLRHHRRSPELEIDATLVQASGQEVRLERVLEHGAARHFIGASIPGRISRTLSRSRWTRWLPAGVALVPWGAINRWSRWDRFPVGGRSSAAPQPPSPPIVRTRRAPP
jgi:hypothetical protein